MKHTSKVVNTVASLLGAVSLDFAMKLEGDYQKLVIYLIPAMTVVSVYIITILANLAGIPVVGWAAGRSSSKLIKEIKDQLEDPDISDERNVELRKQYNEHKDTILALRTKKFTLLDDASNSLLSNAENTAKKGLDNQLFDQITSEAEGNSKKSDTK